MDCPSKMNVYVRFHNFVVVIIGLQVPYQKLIYGTTILSCIETEIPQARDPNRYDQIEMKGYNQNFEASL